MKDYYEILGLAKGCSEEDIRKNYRKLAMRYHPDRNPDDPDAEEKFKNIAEAYGVLTDPVKRREYDTHRTTGRFGSSEETGFSYSQEDILRDLFKDPQFQRMFSGILREFQRSGFRYSSHFIRKAFFGGKGGFLLGSIFLVGSIAGPLIGNAARRSLPSRAGLVKSLGSAVGALINKGGKALAGRQQGEEKPHLREYDLTYHTPLTGRELDNGKTIQVLVYGEEGEQTLRVTIPPNAKDGQRLRLRGKGRPGPFGRGDLYLQLTRRDD